jgi:hypothetical protein
LTHFSAAMISGFACSVTSMPFDLIKTRMQEMQKNDGRYKYSGVANTLKKTVSCEGFLALWRGFLPYYARAGSITVLTLLFLEQLQKL